MKDCVIGLTDISKAKEILGGHMAFMGYNG